MFVSLNLLLLLPLVACLALAIFPTQCCKTLHIMYGHWVCLQLPVESKGINSINTAVTFDNNNHATHDNSNSDNNDG